MSRVTLAMLNYQIEHATKACADISRGIDQSRDQIVIAERSLDEQREHLDALRALRDVLTSGRLTGSGEYPTVPATPPAPPMPDGPIPHDPGDQAIRDRVIAVQSRIGWRAELRAGNGTVLARGVLDSVDARCVYLRDLEAGREIVALAEMYGLTDLPPRQDTGAWESGIWEPDQTTPDDMFPSSMGGRVIERLKRLGKPNHETPEDESR